MIHPSALVLQSALFTFLGARLGTLADIRAENPKDAANFTANKGRVTIAAGPDNSVGRYLTRALSEPTLRFVVYHPNTAQCGNLLAALEEALLTWNSTSFTMTGQKVLSLRLTAKIGPYFDGGLNVFEGYIDADFKLALL